LPGHPGPCGGRRLSGRPHGGACRRRGPAGRCAT
jgi:hypothetical protein